MPQPEPLRKFVDFAPDVDSIQNGVVVDVDSWYPTTAGFATLPGLTPYSPPLPAKCQGIFGARVQAGFIIVAGTANQLYQLIGGAWVSQGITATTTTNRWRFSCYGNDIIAVNGVDRPFVSSNGATFGNLGGTPPVSDLVAATDYSLFLMNPAASFTWISSLSDTIWATSIATQTVSAPITATPGIVTAMTALRSMITFHKHDSFYAGYFTQPPFFWDIRKVSALVGSPSQENVVVAEDNLYWVGPDDFYQFDGYNLNRIPNNIRGWFFNTSFDQSFDYSLCGRYDTVRDLVFWHYASKTASPAGTIDSWVCYNLRTQKWSRGTLTIEFPLAGTVPATQALTYDAFGTLMGTYGAIPSIPYNWPGFGGSGVQNLSGVVLPDHILYVYGTAPPSVSPGPYITLGDYGDRKYMWECRRLRPGFQVNPGAGNAQVEVLTQYLQGTTPSVVQTVPMSPDGNFNIHVTARLQQFRHRVFAAAEIVDTEVESAFAGEL